MYLWNSSGKKELLIDQLYFFGVQKYVTMTKE